MTMRQQQVFLSFHYERDVWRAAQIRSHGISRLACNDWEPSKINSDDAIAQWIDNQMRPASCTVVLIGSETANRDWINYEIEKSWKDGKGLFGIYVHNILDHNGRQSPPGANPFDRIVTNERKLSHFVKVYDPTYSDSQQVCHYISDNMARWVEDALLIRNQHHD